MEKILMFKGQSKYNALRIFSDYMAEAFTQLGYEVVIVDTVDEFFFKKLQEVINQQYKFVFAFNGIMSEFKIKDQSLYNLMNVTYVASLVDHPIYHVNRTIQDIDKYIVTCVDRANMDFLKNYCMGQVKFLPHVGCMPKKLIPYDDRTYDVIFIGGYKKPELIMENIVQKLGKEGQEIAAFWINNIHLTLEGATQEYMKSKDEECSKEKFISKVIELVLIEEYVRAYYRELVIKRLVEAKIKVNVFSSSWDLFECVNREYLIQNEQIDFLESIEITGNSKVAINVMANIIGGAHERIFSGMLGHAVSVTHRTPYLEENFKDGESIVFYELDKLEELPEKVSDILCNSDKAKLISQSGSAIAERSHQWISRAQTIIEMVNEIK